MCGILGSIDMSIPLAALNTMVHRGPDDHGISVETLRDRTLCLAQRRLAIVDLSVAGHQPMHSDDGQASIIFNGEVYNHLDLRGRLPNEYDFKGHSDTETLLYYLQEYGVEGVRDFNGIFSLAYFDHANDRLFLVRDPYGVKPLYYFIGENDQVLFSSELRAMQCLVGEEKLNIEALALLLRLRYNPAPDTLFKGLKKLRPGHYLKIDLSKKELAFELEYYAIKTRAKTKFSTQEEYIEKYGVKIEEAVERQLMSDVEIGIMLSGGIDSAIVAALAQKQVSQPLKAFTIGFEGDFGEDEVAAAQETAELLGLDHHYRRISFDDFLNQIRICTSIVEEPLATTSMIPMYFLAALASDHVKVVLTGQGADEPLGGYYRYKGELMNQWLPTYLKPVISRLVYWSGTQEEKYRRGARLINIPDEASRFLSTYEIFTQPEIKSLIGVEENLAIQRIKYHHDSLLVDQNTEAVERMMAIDTQLNLADDLLNYTDKITMHFSIECRVPMLDLELVRFIESLPRALKLNLQHGKIIHKKYAKKILPASIINRPKNDFRSPTRVWFERESGTIAEILLSSGSNFSKIFNQRAVSSILHQHQQGFNKEKQIFLLLSIYYWLETL